VEADDGLQAVTISGQNPIDLLITDLVMPNAEGMEIIQHFSRNHPHVPIVAISGKSAYLAPAKILGAAATIEKTRVFEDLLSVVQRVLDGN
jgi:two-component system, OmpR family, response regulator